jgi:hypothetical protein
MLVLVSEPARWHAHGNADHPGRRRRDELRELALKRSKPGGLALTSRSDMALRR